MQHAITLRRASVPLFLAEASFALSLACCLSFAKAPAATGLIANMRADANGRVHIVGSSGQEVLMPKEKGQVGVESLQVAPNKRTAGWLVDNDNCCTSYPIALTLIIYRVGKPLLRLGDGMMICDWKFVNDGSQVAFSTNTVHGDFAPHYELHEVANGKVLAKLNGHLDANAPEWAAKLWNQ